MMRRAVPAGLVITTLVAIALLGAPAAASASESCPPTVSTVDGELGATSDATSTTTADPSTTVTTSTSTDTTNPTTTVTSTSTSTDTTSTTTVTSTSTDTTTATTTVTSTSTSTDTTSTTTVTSTSTSTDTTTATTTTSTSTVDDVVPAVVLGGVGGGQGRAGAAVGARGLVAAPTDCAGQGTLAETGPSALYSLLAIGAMFSVGAGVVLLRRNLPAR